jgi:hypothetical protein
MSEIKPSKPAWRREGCVGGDCDALYPTEGGMIAVLTKITGEDRGRLQHAPASHEEAVFLPDDVIELLRRH